MRKALKFSDFQQSFGSKKDDFGIARMSTVIWQEYDMTALWPKPPENVLVETIQYPYK